MKNKLFTLMIVLPMVAFGCDSLFDKGDVENTYDGPDQVALFPLESTYSVGCANQQELVTIQYISSDGLANSGVGVTFSAGALSTARATTDYTWGTSSPATIAAGTAETDILIDMNVSTIDAFVAPGAADIDSARTFGTYSVTAVGGSGSNADVTVTVPSFGAVTAIDAIRDSVDAARTAGDYASVLATGGSGAGAYFDVSIDGTGATTITIVADSASSRFVASDSLTIAAADIGGTGSDLIFDVTGVSAIAAPSVTVNDGGSGYACDDTFSVAAADIGGTGSDLALEATDLTGRFAYDVGSEVRLLISLDASDAKVAANLDTANVFIRR